jgi:hypothetical protein
MSDQEIARAWWAGVVYFLSLLALGVFWLKALIIGASVIASVLLVYGRRLILRLGVVLMVAGVGVWIGALPAPERWLSEVGGLVASIVAWVGVHACG